MSLTKLFSRRVLCVALGVDHFAVAIRQGRVFETTGAHYQAVANPEQAWQVVLAEVQSWLRQANPALHSLPVRVTLASRWCQMQALPWSDALLQVPTRDVFLQNQFVALFGEEARDWIITSDDAPYGQPRMACAIERDLYDGVQGLLQKGQRLQSLESVLPLAWRAASERIGSRSACAVIEAGRISMVLMQDQRMVGIQAHSLLSGDWQKELAASWSRWVLRQPELANVKQIAVLNLGKSTSATTLASPFESVPMPSYNLPAGFSLLTCDNGS